MLLPPALAPVPAFAFCTCLTLLLLLHLHLLLLTRLLLPTNPLMSALHLLLMNLPLRSRLLLLAVLLSHLRVALLMAMHERIHAPYNAQHGHAQAAALATA